MARGVADEFEVSGETFVTMMQAADLPDGDDASDSAQLDRARVRAISSERYVRLRWYSQPTFEHHL